MATTDNKVVGTDKKVEGPEKAIQEAVKPTTTQEKRVADIAKKESEQIKEVLKELENPAVSTNTPDNNTVTPGSSPMVEYRVQVLASQKKLPLNAKDFKGVKDLQELPIDGYYKYYSKAVVSYQQALDLKQELGAYFKGAFFVAFKDGVKVPLPPVDQRKK